MSIRRIWTCDRCKAEAEADEGPLPGWGRVVVSFEHPPTLNALDLCKPCQDELKRVWDEWLNPPTLGEIIDREQAASAAHRAGREADREHVEQDRVDASAISRIERIAQREIYKQDAEDERDRRRAEQQAVHDAAIAKADEIDRRRERIEEIAKARGQPRERWKYPAERKPAEDPEPIVREPHQESEDRQDRHQASVMPTPDSVMRTSWPPKIGNAVVCTIGGGGLVEGQRYTVAKVHRMMMGSVPQIELADLRGSRFPITRFRRLADEEAS